MFEPREIDGYRTFLAAMLKRAGQDDPEAMAQVTALLDEARAGLADVAADLMGQTGYAGGYSWGDIGRAHGITRQSARERFTRKS